MPCDSKKSGMMKKGHHSPGDGSGFDHGSFKGQEASEFMNKQTKAAAPVGQVREASRHERVK